MDTAVGPLPAGQPRAALVAEVHDRLAGLAADATVVVGCSGGPDSSALAYLAAEARPDLRVVLANVAHGLRERETDLADRAVVATHAAWLGTDCVGCDVEVVVDGRGVEAAARDARYAALREVAAARGAAAILVGHTADDQAETVLLRIARGVGTDGLGAMAAVAGDVVRPLLRLRRSDVHAFVRGEGLPTATDATNRDPAIRRVRVRDEVLPALQRIGADPVVTLARLADLARDDAAALHAGVSALPDAVRRVGPVVALRNEVLTGSPVALARRVVRRAMGELLDEPPSADTVTRILDTPVGGGATLPGGIALRVEQAWRTLVVAEAAMPPTIHLGVASGEVPCDGPAGGGDGVSGGGPGAGGDGPDGDHGGRPQGAAVAWACAGLRLRVLRPQPGASDAGEQMALALPGVWTPPRQRIDGGRVAPGTVAQRYTIALPAAATDLRLRGPEPGDRIRGPGGTRRVADVLRDAGMPRAVRARWPLVVMGERVVWIPGVAVDAELAEAGRHAPAFALQVAPR